jgi:ubiquinone/menaquinone biosynthesis C-methylase UbiE
MTNKKIDYDDEWTKWSDMKKFGPMSRFSRKIILDMLKNIEFESFLDIGCGEGTLIREIIKTIKTFKVLGTDISKHIIDINRNKINGAEFEHLNVEESFINKKFDLVTAIDVIEHIKDDIAALKNIYKMCGKYFLLSTLQGRMRKFEKNVGHYRNYDRDELIINLKRIGFKVEKIIEWGFPFYSPFYRNLCDKPAIENSTYGKFGLFRKIISEVIYRIFLLNSYKKGDYLFILARVENEF